MYDSVKSAVDRGDHWSLVLLIVLILIGLLIKSPLFSGLHKSENYKVVMNFFWGILGISALVAGALLIVDNNKNQKEIRIRESDNATSIELKRLEIERSYQIVAENQDYIINDAKLLKRFEEASRQIIPHFDKTIDHSRCWIKVDNGTGLLKMPEIMNQQVIATSIPPGVYYTIGKGKDPQFGKMFFKIRLSNGIEGWVRDFELDKNDKHCYD